MTSGNRLAEAVQRAAERAVRALAPTWILGTVTVVNANGTLDIDTPRGAMAGVRRLKSYSAPAVGDVIRVDINADGNWLVIGAMAP